MKLNFDNGFYHPDDFIGFGKYKNKTWKQVKKLDPGYLMWMAGASEDYPNRKKFIDSLFTVELDLMPDQLAAAEVITEELLYGSHRVHRLQGGAGFGKSWTVMEIAQRAKKAGFEVKAMANSYVATQVLAESLNPVGIEPMTIARALALRPDTTSFSESYGPSEDTQTYLDSLLASGNLLCVDEYSMCSDGVVELIYGKMNEPGNTSKLLVIGDNKQLPSPEQDYMCAFDTILPAFKLYIPKRYAADSDLHQLEHLVRKDPLMLPMLLDKLQGDQIIKHNDFNSLCLQMIHDINNHPDDTGLMLFYRRDAVAAANRKIRSIVYGTTVDELVNEERLRVMRTSFLPVRYDHEKGQWVTLNFYSGTFIKACDPAIETVCISFNQPDLPYNTLDDICVDCYTVINNEGDRVPVVFSKTEHQADSSTTGGKEFNAGLNIVKQYCMEMNDWQLYHHYRSKFVQISYGYATTVHRSQGSSVDRIYLNPADVLQGGNNIAPRLAYVAATRAREQLHYVINDTQDGDNNDYAQYSMVKVDGVMIDEN